MRAATGLGSRALLRALPLHRPISSSVALWQEGAVAEGAVAESSGGTDSAAQWTHGAPGPGGSSAARHAYREEAHTFLLALERADVPVNSFRVAAALKSAAALSRELDTVATFPRQLAHMLLTKALLMEDELANPAQFWERAYEEDGAGREEVAQNTPSSEKRALESQADAAFGVRAGGAAAVTSGAAAASGSLSFAADSQTLIAGVNWDKVPISALGPPVGGALSYIPAHEVEPLPAAGPVRTFTPTPVGTLYLTLVADALDEAAARAAAGAAAVEAAAAKLEAAGISGSEAAGIALSLTSGAPLSVEPARWLSGLAGPALDEFGALVAGLRAAGGAGDAGAVRAAAVTSAAQLLRSAALGGIGQGVVAAGGPPSATLPSVGQLHVALAEAVGSGGGTGPAAFSSLHSAAAAAARSSIVRAEGVAVQLNASAAYAGSGAGGAPELKATLPSIAELLSSPPTGTLACPGELTSVKMSLNVGAGPVPFTFGLMPPHLHAARIAAGHVPSMLAPLMTVLSPGEWASITALITAARPGGAEVGVVFLPEPVALREWGAGGEADGVKASPEVLAASASMGASNTVAPLYEGLTVSAASSIDASLPIVPVAMPSSMPTSALNSLMETVGGDATLGATSTSRTHAIATAVSTAPSMASASAYLRYIGRARTAAALAEEARESLAASLEAAAAVPGADADAIESLRLKLKLGNDAALAGELVISDERVLQTLRTSEAALPEAELARMTARPSETLARALRLLRGVPSKADLALQDAVRAATAGVAPAARSGPAAAAAAARVDAESSRGSVDYAKASATVAGAAAAAASRAPPRPDGSLARVGSTIPGLAGSILAASKGLAPAHSVTALGEEDAGGVLGRRSAALAYEAAGTDLMPVPPRAHPADMASMAGLVKLAAAAAGGSDAARASLTEWLPSAGGATKESALALDVRQRLEALLLTGGASALGPRAGRGGSADAANVLDPRNAVLRVPKLGADGEAVEREGAVGALREADLERSINIARAEESTREATLRDMAEMEEFVSSFERGLPGVVGEGEQYGEQGSSPWWRHTYAAGPSYRAPSQYETVHRRLLEALAARDLNAAWVLWTEHCRLHDQCGDPDVLALEIMMDGAASARRPDLLFNVLWPRAMAWRVEPTAAMGFALLKGACLDGNTATGEALLDLHVEQGWPVDGRHHTALISAYVAAGRLPAAYAKFNKMLRAGFPAGAQLFATLFAGARAAALPQDVHYLWRCLEASHGLSVPPHLYTLVVTSLGEAGLLDDMEAAVVRMGRKRDSAGPPPEPGAYAAAALAFTKAGLDMRAKDVAR
jgi:pentatricopeptide repeat protein